MPYACSNNGLTQQWHDPGENYQPKAGETMLNSVGSATLAATFPGYTAAVAAAAVPATLATKLATGIAITSTSTAALSTTYALDDVTLAQIGSVAQDAAAGLGLPGGGATFVYPDINSVPRTFTSAQIIALYKAMRDLVFQLQTQAAIAAAGGVPVYPAQSATIA